MNVCQSPEIGSQDCQKAILCDTTASIVNARTRKGGIPTVPISQRHCKLTLNSSPQVFWHFRSQNSINSYRTVTLLGIGRYFMSRNRLHSNGCNERWHALIKQSMDWGNFDSKGFWDSIQLRPTEVLAEEWTKLRQRGIKSVENLSKLSFIRILLPVKL